jgi:hypothetical protein
MTHEELNLNYTGGTVYYIETDSGAKHIGDIEVNDLRDPHCKDLSFFSAQGSSDFEIQRFRKEKGNPSLLKKFRKSVTKKSVVIFRRATWEELIETDSIVNG